MERHARLLVALGFYGLLVGGGVVTGFASSSDNGASAHRSVGPKGPVEYRLVIRNAADICTLPEDPSDPCTAFMREWMESVKISHTTP